MKMILTDVSVCPRDFIYIMQQDTHGMFKHIPVLVHHPFQLGTGNTESNLLLAFHCSFRDFPPRQAAVFSVLPSPPSVRYHLQLKQGDKVYRGWKSEALSPREKYKSSLQMWTDTMLQETVSMVVYRVQSSDLK